jgi:ankyrin repeat protein
MLTRNKRARQARDALGHTPLETAMARGAIPDVELFMLLSEAE